MVCLTTTTTTTFIYTTKKESLVLTWNASFCNCFVVCTLFSWNSVLHCIIICILWIGHSPFGSFHDQCKQIMITKYSFFVIQKCCNGFLCLFRKSHGSQQRKGTPSFSPLVKSLWYTVQGDPQLRKNVKYGQCKILFWQIGIFDSDLKCISVVKNVYWNPCHHWLSAAVLACVIVVLLLLCCRLSWWLDCPVQGRPLGLISKSVKTQTRSTMCLGQTLSWRKWR